MYKALVLKELRETIGITLVVLLVFITVVAYQMGYNIFLFSKNPKWDQIPFLTDNYLVWFVYLSAALSTGLGLWQTLVENNRGTWLFLLHRPMELKKLIGIKMAVGVGLYLLIPAGATLFYAVWAATPGTHPSPFYWWMTVPVWEAWFIILLCYFAAFLTGIRPGRWFGTRLLPLAAAGLLAFFCTAIIFGLQWQLCGLIAVGLLCSVIIGVIFYIARTRDFS